MRTRYFVVAAGAGKAAAHPAWLPLRRAGADARRGITRRGIAIGGAAHFLHLNCLLRHLDRSLIAREQPWRTQQPLSETCGGHVAVALASPSAFPGELFTSASRHGRTCRRCSPAVLFYSPQCGWPQPSSWAVFCCSRPPTQHLSSPECCHNAECSNAQCRMAENLRMHPDGILYSRTVMHLLVP